MCLSVYIQIHSCWYPSRIEYVICLDILTKQSVRALASILYTRCPRHLFLASQGRGWESGVLQYLVVLFSISSVSKDVQLFGVIFCEVSTGVFGLVFIGYLFMNNL